MTDTSNRKGEEDGLTRRAFIGGTGGVIAVATLSSAQATSSASVAEPTPVPRTNIHVTVNGTAHDLEVEDRWTLVELLRDHLGLTGTKIGCDRVECLPINLIASSLIL